MENGLLSHPRNSLTCTLESVKESQIALKCTLSDCVCIARTHCTALENSLKSLHVKFVSYSLQLTCVHPRS